MTTDNHAERNALAHLETIQEYYAATDSQPLRLTDSDTVTIAGETMDRDDLQQRIYETPLSVEIRTGWYTPGSEPDSADEYKILLSTGGPACQICGIVGEYGDPLTAIIQHQDWGTPWTDLYTDSDQDEALLWFASQFIMEY